MIEIAGAVLGATLLGSPHCAGMCGGFVCFVSGEASGPRRWLVQAAYHAGRLISYVSLGIVAGRLGEGIERLGASVGFFRAAPIVAGALMILWGGANLLAALGKGKSPSHAPSPLSRFLAPAVRAMRDWPPLARGFAIGLVTTLIPCGFLYGFVAVAGGSGSPLGGAFVMATFWAGTLPVLASVGLLADRAVGALKLRLPVVSASILIVLGLLTLAGRLQPMSAHRHHGMMPMGVEMSASGAADAPLRAPNASTTAGARTTAGASTTAGAKESHAASHVAR
jgi:sulfite exporter TauE/SafE